jgi:SAM-dependent methyltransferase
MNSTRPSVPAADVGASSLALFELQWRVYRKVVDCDLMEHRKVYGRLRRMLEDEAPDSFRFLDIACGDACASVDMLLGTNVAAYHGIDLSDPALELAHEQIGRLRCHATLERADFALALRQRSEVADVIWLGQSLHHLLSPAKFAVMLDVRRLLADGGLFLLWEPTRFENESREAWLTRFEDRWQAYTSILTAEEWSAMADHVRAADFPETGSTWISMGREAGFGRASELVEAPFDLARLYCFRP